MKWPKCGRFDTGFTVHNYVHSRLHKCKYIHIHTYTHTLHTYIHTYIQKNMQILLPLGGHTHLAEPGCLCTKQALGAVQANSWRTG